MVRRLWMRMTGGRAVARFSPMQHYVTSLKALTHSLIFTRVPTVARLLRSRLDKFTLAQRNIPATSSEWEGC
jgi:hypothetical protein